MHAAPLALFFHRDFKSGVNPSGRVRARLDFKIPPSHVVRPEKEPSFSSHLMNKAAGGQGGIFLWVISSGFRRRDSFPTGLRVRRDSEQRRRTSGPSTDPSSDVHKAPHFSSLRWRCCPTLGRPACDLTA